MGEKLKQFIIRYYSNENEYTNLGISTGFNEKDAIQAYLGRKENINENRKLTADEVIDIDFGGKDGS